MTMTEERITTGATTKAAHDLRKAINGAHGGGQSRLFTNEVNGEMWVAYSFWMAPVARFSALWDGTPPAGTWMTGINDKSPAVEHLQDFTAPNIAQVVPAGALEESGAIELEQATLRGVNLYSADSAPMFDHDGTLFALNATYLDLLADQLHRKVTVPPTYKRLSPVTVWRSLNYNWARGGSAQAWSVAGIVMPIRCDTAHK